MASPRDAVFHQDKVLTGGILTHANIRRCKLRNVSIFGCHIVSSTLEDCSINQSVVGAANLERWMLMKGFESAGYNCHLRKCRLESSVIHDSKICHSTLWDMRMVDACIIETTHWSGQKLLKDRFHQSQFQQCVLADISLDDRSILLDCELSQGCLIKSEELIPKPVEGNITRNIDPPFNIDRFPPEIKTIVLSYCLQSLGLEDSHDVPAIIPALRAHQKLYEEVLNIYYWHGSFSIKGSNERRRAQLSPRTFERIRELTICDFHFDTSMISEKMRGIMKLKRLNLGFYKPMAFRTFDEDIESGLKRFYYVLQDWLSLFKGLQELSLIFRTIDKRNHVLEAPFDSIKHVSICSKISEEITAFDFVRTVDIEGECEECLWLRAYVRWTWKAHKGSTLLWKEGSHQSIE